MGKKVIDQAAAYEAEVGLGSSDGRELNDHIPEEGTDDYEYTEYSRTNKTNDHIVNALSESEGHKEMLSERMAPATS